MNTSKKVNLGSEEQFNDGGNTSSEQKFVDAFTYGIDFFDEHKIKGQPLISKKTEQLTFPGEVNPASTETAEQAVASQTRAEVGSLVKGLNDGSPLSEKSDQERQVLIFDQKIEKGDYFKEMVIGGNQLVSGLFSNNETGRFSNGYAEIAMARVSAYNDKLAISMIDSVQRNKEDQVLVNNVLNQAKASPEEGADRIANLGIPLSRLGVSIDLKNKTLKYHVATSHVEHFQGSHCYVFNGKEIIEHANQSEDYQLQSGDIVFVASNNILTQLTEQNISRPAVAEMSDDMQNSIRDYRNALLPAEVKTLLSSSVTRDGGKIELNQGVLFDKLSEIYIRLRMNEEEQQGQVVASYVAYQVP